ncbi:MAG TPA: AlkA N-terminal domain-containing protein [Gemmatimonadaceae bacterium]|nr:AlkA N-terminal domain-containing protein [Gemmatimonadaceae bacterium]
MTDDTAALYSALTARDPRFDGVFYVGVTSTGIYCRPVCTARTPKRANCRFFPSAELAEKARFRPCLRCRPELAPGSAPVDDARRVASLLARRIEEGAIDDPSRDRSGAAGLERIAAQFGWSSRQIRRMVNRELGVSPMELVLTRRLLLAKQLLTETALPVGEVAFASGFASLRRFNDAFSRRYGMPPSRLRKTRAGDAAGSLGTTGAATTAPLTLRLTYRPPFDWDGTMRFLAARTLAGVEVVTGDGYARTARVGGHAGWLRVRHAPDERALVVELSHSLAPALPAVLGRLRGLFDLSARPDVIAAHLAEAGGALADAVARNPGLRVPGAFDGFELAMRAILGQQVTVKAATTLAGRIVAAFGEPIETPHAGLTHLAPTAARVADASVAKIAALGVVRTRAASIVALASEVASGRLELEAGAPPEATMERLVALPGVGAWTAHYVAMRALRWPDAFPKEDVVLRKRLGGVTPAAAEALSQAWRPWRSYATLHLWRSDTPAAP